MEPKELHRESPRKSHMTKKARNMADLDEFAQLHADVCRKDLWGDTNGLPPIDRNAQLQRFCGPLPPGTLQTTP